jgi:hypothetical protein
MNQEIKEIKSELKEISVVLARNTASLEQHVKRTELAETRIEKLETWHLGILASILLAIVIKLFI